MSRRNPFLPPNVHSVSATLHPAFAMRGLPWVFPTIRRTMSVARMWGRSPVPPQREFSLNLEPTIEDLHAYLRNATVAAIDVETPEESPHRITICGVSVNDGSAIVFPWTGDFPTIMKSFLERPDVVKVGHNFTYDLAAFKAYGIDTVGPMVDTMPAAALLWPPFKKKKKQDGEREVPLPWFGLAPCAMRVLDDVPYWKRPDSLRARALFKASWPDVPHWLHPYLYNALDCIYTRRLWLVLRDLIIREGMFELLRDIVAPTTEVLADMEALGLPADRVKIKRLRKHAEEVRGGIETGIQAECRDMRIAVAHDVAAAAGRHAVNKPTPTSRCPKHEEYIGLIRRQKCSDCAEVYLQSAGFREGMKDWNTESKRLEQEFNRLTQPFDASKPDQWRELLFDPRFLGLMPPEVTPVQRKPVIAERVIEQLARKNPKVTVLKSRLELAHIQHRLSVTLNPTVETNGRVRFAYSLHRTTNGRLASGLDDDEPEKIRRSGGGNAQNIPERDREIYCVSRPGRMFISADWSQVETRVMAWLAREVGMLRAFARGDDVHALNAAAIYGIRPEDSRTHMVMFEGTRQSARRAAKRATHGWDYGLGDVTFARTYGVSIAAARRARESYFRAWPGLRHYQTSLLERVKADRYLINPFGRKLRFWRWRSDGSPEDREEAFAFIPASTVGDMCKAVLPRLNAIPNSDLLTTTHDSFLIETDEKLVDTVAPIIVRILQDPWPQLGEISEFGLFHAPCDVAIGRNWGKESPENPEGLKECPSSMFKTLCPTAGSSVIG